MTRMLATSFADAEDLRRFNRALLQGQSTREALEVGDNGLGAWGASTVAGTGPCVALSPNTAGFRPNRVLRVFYGEKSVDAFVRDIGPSERIDLNPDAAAELGLKPPFKVMVDWVWL